MKKLADNFRPLTESETAQLNAQGNRAPNWSAMRVANANFSADNIHNCAFEGDVFIGTNVTLKNAYVTSTPDNAAHKINVINENGGRAILPHPDMTSLAAFVWAKERGNKKLMEKFDKLSNDFYGEPLAPKTIIGDNAHIGHGVHICNSFIGCGSLIDTAAQLDNVITGESVAISKAARVTHSFIGDCAHIACCEIANSLIAPFHGQHHNNSFLIAANVGAQSNVAAGATIGSNHNSRASDGEIWAGRGFWPGLCVSLKHNSKFASFSMIAKGDYPAELNVTLPFSLIARDQKTLSTVIHPAFWFTKNMYAAMRHLQKFSARDNRTRRAQFIEFDIFAPDTICEIEKAINTLESNTPLLMERGAEKTTVKNADEAIIAYKLIIRHYCAKNILPFMRDNNLKNVADLTNALATFHNDGDWINCGGTVISVCALEKIIAEIISDSVNSWADVYALLDTWTNTYQNAKVAHALSSLAKLYNVKPARLSDDMLQTFISKVPSDCEKILTLTKSSRQKDFTDPFRTMVYDSQEEMDAVLGNFDDDAVIVRVTAEMQTLLSP